MGGEEGSKADGDEERKARFVWEKSYRELILCKVIKHF